MGECAEAKPEVDPEPGVYDVDVFMVPLPVVATAPRAGTGVVRLDVLGTEELEESCEIPKDSSPSAKASFLSTRDLRCCPRGVTEGDGEDGEGSRCSPESGERGVPKVSSPRREVDDPEPPPIGSNILPLFFRLVERSVLGEVVPRAEEAFSSLCGFLGFEVLVLVSSAGLTMPPEDVRMSDDDGEL